MTPTERPELAREIVGLLNSAFAVDPVAIRAMFSTRVQCNEALAGHPTIQVLEMPDPLLGRTCWVGVIGVLNGLFPGRTRVAMELEMASEDPFPAKLIGFKVVEIEP